MSTRKPSEVALRVRDAIATQRLSRRRRRSDATREAKAGPARSSHGLAVLPSFIMRSRRQCDDDASHGGERRQATPSTTRARCIANDAFTHLCWTRDRWRKNDGGWSIGVGLDCNRERRHWVGARLPARSLPHSA